MIDLHHADCITTLQTLAPAGVDAVITDPPYLVTNIDFDTDLDLSWPSLCLRIVKPNGYLAAFGTITTHSNILSQGWILRFPGIWLKSIAARRFANSKKPPGQHELFVVYAHPDHTIAKLTWNTVYHPGDPYRTVEKRTGTRQLTPNQLTRASTKTWTKDGYVIDNPGRRTQTSVLRGPPKCHMPHKERTPHPTQKPTKVLATLIRWLTNPHDTILDPFMGSGSTGAACIPLERNFIGIELHADYFAIAKHRLEELAQDAGTEVQS